MTELVEGIYLEVKQGTLGTGNTASRTTFRNFYAVRLVGDEVDLHLLDDRLGLTGLKETVPLARFPRQLSHQPKLAPYFDKLKPSLAAARPPQARPAPQPPAARPEAAPPAARPVASPPQARPEAGVPQTRPPAQPPAEQKDSPWWEMTSRGSGNLLTKK